MWVNALRLSDLLLADGANIDRTGGRVALDRQILTASVRKAYDGLLRPLRARDFWQAAVESNAYLPPKGLWAPQRRAIALSAAYLAARREYAVDEEAALIKMPTGSGKTAVIATLACALPQIKRTLVITPRRALVDQMYADLFTRFWSRFDLIYDGDNVRPRRDGDASPDGPYRDNPVRRLLPSLAEEITGQQGPRAVVVGTFTALEQVLRPKRPASRHSAGRPDRETQEDSGNFSDLDAHARDRLADYLRSFDLVIVDESHYEPAYVWSQCIRSLKCPTILFSATPYRNDFKYFSITGRFAFNLSFQEAEKQKLIRPVKLMRAKDLGLADEASFIERLDALRKRSEVAGLKFAKKSQAKIIVRVDDHDAIIRMQKDIAKATGEKPVVIHHRESAGGDKQRRFKSVTRALKSQHSEGAVFWLHQWKLLEGVDENSFVAIAVSDELPNTRAVIQQVGRVLRFANRGRRERGVIVAAPDIEEEMFGRWQRYLDYEAYFDRDPGEALTREANVLRALNEAAPELQYMGGDFRSRLDIDARDLTAGEFLLPCRATIFRNSEDASLDELAESCREAMGVEDRHHAIIVQPGKDDPQNIRIIPYMTWANSEFLSTRALPLWSFGLMAIVCEGKRVYLLDTQGLVIDPERLGLEQEAIHTLHRLLPEPKKGEQARVSQASAVSLDLSDASIRSVTARMRDFRLGFFDLAEGMQAATAMRAYLRTGTESVTRYLSLQRSSVSDAPGGAVPIGRYVQWVEAINSALDTKIAPSRAFQRFAQAQSAPPRKEALPRNILFDFDEMLGLTGEPAPLGWDSERTELLRAADRCLDVDEDGKFTITIEPDAEFEGALAYEVTGRVRRRGRYVVECEGLDEFLLAKNRGDEKPRMLSRWLTQEQSFRVVPQNHELVYAQRHFYKPAIDFEAVAEERPGGNPLESVIPSAWLAHVTSEKGRASDSAEEWANNNIFGGIYSHFGKGNRGAPAPQFKNVVRTKDEAFASRLDNFDLVVCDDGGAEFCDFVCLDRSRGALVLIHAKADDTSKSLNALQAVGRQALASLAFLTRAYVPADRSRNWAKPVSLGTKRISTRLVHAPEEADAVAAWEAVVAAMRSANVQREIWIVSGRTLERNALKQSIIGDPTPHDLQLVYFLAAVQTSAARANVNLKLFCSP